MQAGGRSSFALLCLALVLFAVGCRNNDVLESELRHRDTLYREALAEQQKAECRADALQREVELLRQGPARMPPEQAALALGVKRLTLGRSTGGYDKDGLPGDELLQVVVEPRDCDDHVIKAPGVLQICALEVTPQGLKVPISSWELGPDELRKQWKQGLLSTGYTLLLPWKQYPQTDTVRVVARLIVADGRPYETDRDVKVRCVPGAPPRPPAVTAEPLPASRPPDVTGSPVPATELPTPRVLPPSVPPPPDPFLLPSSRSVPSEGEYRSERYATPWTPATLQGSVRVGRPRPLPDP